MAIAILIVVALIETGIFAFLMRRVIAAKKKSFQGIIENLQAHLTELEGHRAKIEAGIANLVGFDELKTKVLEARGLKESLKTERGRITITQAERETVEGRLRELEEIERELEASGIETKEELNILKKKEKELTQKNDALKSQIADSMAKIDKLLGEIGVSAQVQEQVMAMKTQLITTQDKIDVLLLQIEQGNEQYFILKKRYDALDIEYAQLFEKFSETQG